MENQGKTEKQIKDSEAFAFWGLMGLFISIAVIAISPSSSTESEKELKESKLTIERLKKSHDSLQWKYDSVWGQEIHNTRMLNRYQTGYDIFLRRDPQGAKMFGDIMSDETQ